MCSCNKYRYSNLKCWCCCSGSYKSQNSWTLQSIQLFGSFFMRHCIGLKLAKLQAVSEPEISWLMTSVDDEWRHGGYHYRQCQWAWRHGGGVVAEVTGTFTSFNRAFFVDVLQLLVITRTNDFHDLIYSIRWWQLARCLIYSYALIEYINRFAVDGMVTFFFTMLTVKFAEEKVLFSLFSVKNANIMQLKV